MKRKLVLATLALIATLLPVFAFAHIGADAGIHHGLPFFMGFVHPFTGFDHLAAMVTVGIWSALVFQDSPKRMWAVPVAFATLLMVGGLIGFETGDLAIVEPMIAASLLVLGLLVATQFKLSVVPGALLVGGFAIFHGIAHGSELSAAAAVATLSGMVLGTMILHICGMLLGHFLLNRNVWMPRVVGTIVTLLGLGLLFGVLEA
jgi:urease accessory protein